jgi:hypothetical protein
MDVKTRIQKLSGHSEGLLTFYLGTVRKYSVLDPMISSQEVCNKYGSKLAFNGYMIVREALYYGVIQDIANMFFDNGKTNPSILNIRDMLNNKLVLTSLEGNYTSEYVPDDEATKSWYENRKMEKSQKFKTYHNELVEYIKILNDDQELKSCKSIRDEFTAHIDLQFSEEKYSYPDISKYGLKWNTPKRLLTELKPIICRIGYIVRDADFAWESFESQNNRMASGLWSI